MRGKILVFVILLISSLWFLGCAQPEEAPAVEDQAAAEEYVEKPEPGDMVLVPAGEFVMGTDKDPHRLKLAEPAHTVDLPAYEIDVFEVTNGDFARFQIEYGGAMRPPGNFGRKAVAVVLTTSQRRSEWESAAGTRGPLRLVLIERKTTGR